MAPLIEQTQQALVGHRMNFWAWPSSGNTGSWRYKSQSWMVKRPDDGQPASPRSIRCEVCEKSLTYFVHSVQATEGRQKRWRTITYGGLAFFVVGLLGLILLVVVGGGGPISTRRRRTRSPRPGSKNTAAPGPDTTAPRPPTQRQDWLYLLSPLP
jgi:hypothetical protein